MFSKYMVIVTPKQFKFFMQEVRWQRTTAPTGDQKSRRQRPELLSGECIFCLTSSF